MMPVTFDGWNLELLKPDSMTDEECTSMPAFKGVDNGGYKFILTVWKPNKEDIEAINAGRPICLKILTDVHPVVSLYTYDEKFKSN